MKLVKAAGFSSSTSWEGRAGPQALSFQDIALLKAVLTAGLYDSVGKIMCTKSVDVTEKLACMVETAQGRAQVHPSSVNRGLQTYGWLLFQEKVSRPLILRSPRAAPGLLPRVSVAFSCSQGQLLLLLTFEISHFLKQNTNKFSPIK